MFIFWRQSTSCGAHKIEYLLCCTVSKQIDEAANVVTALMEDINEQLFVPTAIADITGAQPVIYHAPITPPATVIHPVADDPKI